MRKIAIIIALSLVPASAYAVNDQLLRSIEHGLRKYQIQTDVSKLTLNQAVALNFELSNSDGRGSLDRLRKRQRILNILRKGEDW